MSERAQLIQDIYNKLVNSTYLQLLVTAGQLREIVLYNTEAPPEVDLPYTVFVLSDIGIRDNDVVMRSNLAFSVYTLATNRLLQLEMYDAITKTLHFECVGVVKAAFHKNDNFTPVATGNENIMRSDFSFGVVHTDQQILDLKGC